MSLSSNPPPRRRRVFRITIQIPVEVIRPAYWALWAFWAFGIIGWTGVIFGWW